MVGHFIDAVVRYVAHWNPRALGCVQVHIVDANSITYDRSRSLHRTNYVTVYFGELCNDGVCVSTQFDQFGFALTALGDTRMPAAWMIDSSIDKSGKVQSVMATDGTFGEFMRRVSGWLEVRWVRDKIATTLVSCYSLKK